MCQSEGDFTQPVINKIRDYFDGGAGKDIHSFISVPLFDCRDDDGTLGRVGAKGRSDVDDQHLIGVLNIHSNKVGLLSDAFEPFAEYYLTISPLCVLLTELVQAWKKLSAADVVD